jgi:hypothetical protein
MADNIGRRLLLSGAVGGWALTASRAQADTTFTSFAFPATGARTPRTMPDRLADIINVKDYGAVGDGSTNDTSAIQAAFDAAFGTPGSPHGTNAHLNRPVFFPAGVYKTTAPLTLSRIRGGHIFGAGQLASRIKNVTSGSVVVVTNGCDYTLFENISFEATGTGSRAFDLDWDNAPPVALNGNTFINAAFSAEIGCNIAPTGYMGSETTFIACSFFNCSGNGLVTRNPNALDQTIIECNFLNCGIGIKVITGSIQCIVNSAFAVNGIDISVNTNCANAIIGCRTESATFIDAPQGTFSIISCKQEATGPGKFINNMNGSCFLSGCYSYVGKIGNPGGSHGALDIRACDFDQASTIVSSATNNGSGQIRLTVAYSGFWETGDTVSVSGVGGVIAANGTWKVTVIDPTHIDLQGSSFSGRYTTGGTVVPAFGSYLSTWTGPVATSWSRDQRQSRTTNLTIPRGLSGQQFDNLGATTEVNFTLSGETYADNSIAGTKFGFYVAAPQTLKVIADHNMTIRVAGSVSAANGSISANTVGNYVELEAISTSEWVAKSVVGTWKVT